jgi:hypothetical protein
MSKFKPALPPGTAGAHRLSIDGWRVTYYEPTHGTISEIVTDHDKLAKMKRWLNEGGYSYKVKEIRG